MKRTLQAIGALLLLMGACFAQTTPVGQIIPNINISKSHFSAGFYNAPAYATWQGIVLSGNTTTGSGASIIVYPQGAANGVVTIADGTSLPLATVFNTSTPIIVDLGQGASEVFIPTSVSFGGCPAGNLGVGGTSTCATIVGNIGNTHGQSALVGSGDMGMEEAITDASNFGGGDVYFERDCGNVTLNTGGAVTTIAACQVPLNFTSLGGSALVKTTVTTAASYSLGTTTTATAFINACTSLTAGTNCNGFTAAPTKVSGATFALTNLLITANATPGAGVVHVKAWGYSQVQSAQ